MKTDIETGSVNIVPTVDEPDTQQSRSDVVVLHALASADGYVPVVDRDGLIAIDTPRGLTFLETGHRFTTRDLGEPDPYGALFEAARREHEDALEERLETLLVHADVATSDFLLRFFKEPGECSCAHHDRAWAESDYLLPGAMPGWNGVVSVAIWESDGHQLVRNHEPRARVDLADTSLDVFAWMDGLLAVARSLTTDNVDFS